VDLAPNDLERILAGRVNCAREAFLQIADVDSLVIRNWQQGDRYTPLGCSGRKKLKACFREQKLSILERSTLPIVTLSDATIVWVPYLPPADKFKLDTQSKSALRLTYELSKAT
jgi:tRNA(Ile)-lysidine synthetase-like protein